VLPRDGWCSFGSLVAYWCLFVTGCSSAASGTFFFLFCSRSKTGWLKTLDLFDVGWFQNPKGHGCVKPERVWFC